MSIWRCFLTAVTSFWICGLQSTPLDSIWHALPDDDPPIIIEALLTALSHHEELKGFEKLMLLERAEPLAETIENPELTVRYLLAKSDAYLTTEDYSRAQDFGFQALDRTPQLTAASQRKVYSQIARIYYYLAAYDKSLEFSRKAFEISLQLKDSSGIAAGYSRLGDAYRRMGKRDTALRYLNQAIELREKMGSIGGLAKAYNNLGIFHIETEPATIESHKNAIEAWQKSLEFKEQMGDSAGMVYSLLNISVAGPTLPGRVEDAMEYVDRALEISHQIEFNHGLRASYHQAAILYAKTGNYELAYDAYTRYHEYDQKLASENVKERIAEVEVVYQTRLKEREIDLLSTQNFVQEIRLTRQRWILGCAFLALALLTITLVTLRRNAKLKLERKEREAEFNRQHNERRITALKQEQDFRMMKALVHGQEQERKRIARDLHDQLGALMAGVKINLQTLTGFATDEVQMKLIADTKELTDSAGKEIRRTAHNLMPASIANHGLDKSLHQLFDQLNQGNHLPRFTYQSYGVNGKLEEEQEIHLFRILQELTNNTLKHAEASTVLVDLSQDSEGIHLVYEDDGKGFDSARVEEEGGLGITSIRSRITALQGEIDIHSSAGEGSSFNIFIPLHGRPN